MRVILLTGIDIYREGDQLNYGRSDIVRWIGFGRSSFQCSKVQCSAVEPYKLKIGFAFVHTWTTPTLSMAGVK